MSRKVSRKVQILILLSFSIGCIYLQSVLRQTPECSCEKCHIDDPWFSARFNSAYHPLMTRNSTVSAEDFQWWKRLQNTQSGQDEYKEVVNKIFQAIPDKEMYRDDGLERYRVCSVVGNSGNLVNSRYGPMIDSSDFVFRINRGPTKGFEQDVGSKTTHRVIYPESAFHMDNSTHMVFFAFKMKDLEWLVMVVSPSFMKYVHHQWLKKHGQYPSTGFMTVIMALHICDKVRVFGFGADKDGYWNHYFERRRPKNKTGNHGGNFEYDTLKELQKRNKLQVYGWPATAGIYTTLAPF